MIPIFDNLGRSFGFSSSLVRSGYGLIAIWNLLFLLGILVYLGDLVYDLLILCGYDLLFL